MQVTGRDCDCVVSYSIATADCLREIVDFVRFMS